jgi:hypothetical protein
MIIKRRIEGYYVLTESGRNLGGPYQTQRKAEERLRQAEYFMRRDELSRKMREVIERG